MDPITIGIAIDLGLKLFGMHKQNKAEKRAQKLREQQYQMSQQEYYARQQRIQEWNEKYGSVEHNLLQYVKGLDASNLYGRMSGGISRGYEEARKNMDAHLADRGFDVAGGVHAEMFANLADQELQTKLKHQQLAEQYVAQQNQQLLSHNTRPQDPSTVNMQKNLGQQASAQMASVNTFNKNVDSIGTSIGQFAGYSKTDRSIQAGRDKARRALGGDTTAREVKGIV